MHQGLKKEITSARNNTDRIRINRKRTRKQKWEEKQLCRYFKRLASEILQEKTWTWLRKGNFKRETESIPIATQSNTTQTNYMKTKIVET